MGSVAKIRGMKVVTYCSAACAEGRAVPVAVSFPPPAPAIPLSPPSIVMPSPAPTPTSTSTSTTTTTTTSTTRVDDGWEVPKAPVRPQRAAPVAAEAQLEALFEAEPQRAARGRRNRGVVLIAGLALVGGGVIVASQYWPGGGRNQPRAAEGSPSGLVAGPGPAALAGAAAATNLPPASPPRLDRGELLERATAELRSLMGSASPRVQRIAAMALARSRDRTAIDRLRGLLAAEKNPLVRVEIGYALARAGEPVGVAELHAALGSQRRDARLDAARSLVALGDRRGAEQLRSFLSYTEYRIGAAGLLARIGEPKGTAALRQAIAARKQSPENEMRAVVALGAAGDAAVRDRLLEILRDGRYQVGAAQALAVLGDPAAVPSLLAQLDVDAFRVTAALALRRMRADVDLAPLAGALQAGNDVVRVTAAEAILVLTGPENLAERD